MAVAFYNQEEDLAMVRDLGVAAAAPGQVDVTTRILQLQSKFRFEPSQERS